MAKSRSKKNKSRLLKFGFRSIFKHKVFTILMFVLVLLSGSTYTLLDTSNNSFQQSYNEVVETGQLHDYVIKENFKTSATSTPPVIKGVDSTNHLYDLTKDNVASNKHLLVGGNEGTVKLKAEQLQGDYASLNTNLLTKTITFPNYNSSDFTKEWSFIQNEIENYRSAIVYSVEKGLANTFVDTVRNNFGKEVLLNNNRSISVAVDKSAFNVVQYNNDTQVNIMHIYDGTDKFTKQLTDQELTDEVNARIRDKGFNPADYDLESLKGFKVSARDATGGEAVSVTDPSSYQAIISPAYANRNDKKSISVEDLSKLIYDQPDLMSNLPKDEKLKEKYARNLVWVDTTPYFIIGIGTTPDYLYPIIDNEHPVVDASSQAIVYVNQRGYERIYDAFRTNPKEEYISLKFKPGVSESRQHVIISQIEELSHKGTLTLPDGKIITSPRTGYPSNIRMVTSANDRTDQMLLTQERTIFLQDLQKTIRTISVVTTTLLVIFLASIIMIVFQMIVGIDRKKLATQLALGYSKPKIAFAKALSGLAISIFPFILSYLIGYGLQFLFIQQFDNYWTVPTFGTSFSWLSLVIIVVIPFIVITGLIFLITLFTLRKPLVDMLSSGGIEGSTLLAKIVAKFQIIGVKGRYAVALTAKNILKLLLVAAASTVSVGALIIGISSIGKADESYVSTVAMNKYEFEVDLYSPTAEGGLYSTVQEEDLATLYHQPTYDNTGHFTGTPGQAHWHNPSLGDAKLGLATSAGSHLQEASQYLKHKIQTKVLLNQDVGGMNPWDIARRLMPDNQKNKIEANAKYIENQQGVGAWSKLSKTLDERGDDRHIPYVITYGDVVINRSDETYTYIDVTRQDQRYKVIGLKENTQMINVNGSINKLKAFTPTSSTVPILINHYIAEKCDLKEGSNWRLKVNNHYRRNVKGAPDHFINAKVVGIVDGYDDKGIYTLQSYANGALGMPKNDIHSFNGVFTKEKNPAVLGTMPLYSPSGLWLGTDTIVGQWESVLDSMLKDSSVWTHPEVATNTAEFISKYSRTPFVGATSAVLWSEISKYTFKNISELSSFIIMLIEAIAISLSIIFTVVIASLLLMSNRKKIATLWTMGYRKREIGRIFLSTYIFPMIIATVLSLVLGASVLLAMREFIMGFGNILIPFQIVWWSPIVAVMVVGLIFFISTIFTIYTQRQSKALESFKGD